MTGAKRFNAVFTTACSSSVSREIPSIYVSQRFITTFTTPYHLPVSSARSTIPNPPSSFLRSIFILSSYPHLGLPNDPFHQVFPTNPTCIPLLCHTYYIPYETPCLWFDCSNNIWWRGQVMKTLIVQFLSWFSGKHKILLAQRAHAKRMYDRDNIFKPFCAVYLGYIS